MPKTCLKNVGEIMMNSTEEAESADLSKAAALLSEEEQNLLIRGVEKLRQNGLIQS